MFTRQYLHASSASEAAINMLIMWTAPIWIPVVGFIILAGEVFADPPYCKDVESDLHKAVIMVSRARSIQDYDMFTRYNDEANKLQRRLNRHKCLDAPKGF